MAGRLKTCVTVSDGLFVPFVAALPATQAVFDNMAAIQKTAVRTNQITEKITGIMGGPAYYK